MLSCALLYNNSNLPKTASLSSQHELLGHNIILAMWDIFRDLEICQLYIVGASNKLRIFIDYSYIADT